MVINISDTESPFFPPQQFWQQMYIALTWEGRIFTVLGLIVEEKLI